MRVKDVWSATAKWLRSHKLFRLEDYQPQVDDQGLINHQPQTTQSEVAQQSEQGNPVVVKTVQPRTNAESLEKLQLGFNKLIDQLEGINNHLNRQLAQSEDLMGRIEQLPRLIESFPAVIENQKQLTEKLLEQLKATELRDQQFVDAVEKIPAQTAKQTDRLVEIDHQLAAAAETDVQMVESFNKFNETLDKLNQRTDGQTDSIMQMSRTFAASDRYLKYIMSKQRKSFMWIFMTAIGICLVVILIFMGIIIYLRQ